jgi:hypothetical protein
MGKRHDKWKKGIGGEQAARRLEAVPLDRTINRAITIVLTCKNNPIGEQVGEAVRGYLPDIDGGRTHPAAGRG